MDICSKSGWSEIEDEDQVQDLLCLDDCGEKASLIHYVGRSPQDASRPIYWALCSDCGAEVSATNQDAAAQAAYECE